MRSKIRVGGWSIFALTLLLLVLGQAQAATDQITTTPQNGVTITTGIDTDLREIYYTFHLEMLPSNYEQIVFKPPMFPLGAIPWVASSVTASGLTEWNIHGLWPGGTPSLELQFQTGSAPPRLNVVTIDYAPEYSFTGSFLGAPGDDNIEVTLRNPPVGVEDNVILWAYYPELTVGSPPGIGESSGPAQGPIEVESYDRLSGNLQFWYGPACGASNHTLVYGELTSPFALVHSGQDCSIGINGLYDWPAPAGSIYFLVVGHDGTAEGSYGTDSNGAERAAYPSGPDCPRPQDLTDRCD
jgi:hypothetical protein